MCMPSAPKPTVVAPVAPAEMPKPMASPDGGGRAMNLSQLRLSNRNPLAASPASGGLTLPKA